MPVTHGVTGSSPVRTAETQGQLRVWKRQSPQFQWIVDFFLYSASANPRTSNSPLRTKFRYQVVTEKLPSDYCNDFHANSLICPLLSQFCLLIIQLITFPLWHCVTIVTKDIKTDAFMSKSTFKILFYLRKNYVNKEGKASIMIRITVNGEMS